MNKNKPNVLKTKRAYEPKSDKDGYRILVDSLWPRRKKTNDVDEWIKNIGPDDDLRKLYQSSVVKYPQFEKLYRLDLNDNPEAYKLLSRLPELLEKDHVTLLFTSADLKHNNAVVLQEWLIEHLEKDQKEKEQNLEDKEDNKGHHTEDFAGEEVDVIHGVDSAGEEVDVIDKVDNAGETEELI